MTAAAAAVSARATGPTTAPARDPLAYRLLQLPGGTVAKFDDWQYLPPQARGGILWCDGFPAGRQRDFSLRAAIGTPTAREMADLFVTGPALVEQLLAAASGGPVERVGDGEKTTCGGDPAFVQQYRGRAPAAAAYTCRALFVKRDDVAVAVIGIGTDDGFRQFGRSIEIVAQSITVKESDLDRGLVGTWVYERHVTVPAGGGRETDHRLNVARSRSITVYPNGTFSDTAQSGFSGQEFTGLARGGHRGRVVKRGPTLTFRYDDGNVWTAGYELHGGGLRLDGKVYLKQ